MVSVQIKKLNKNIALPEYATYGSAALDLRASIDVPIYMEPFETDLIPSGVAIHINNSLLCGMIIPRSGLGSKKGLILSNGTGLIDSDYTGEIMIPVWNRGEKTITIQPYQRIAQLIFVPVVHVKFDIVDSLNETVRGSGGFGSTG